MRYFSPRERSDLLKSWILVGIAFGLFAAHEAIFPPRLDALAWSVGIALCTAGAGIILHELAHKYVAMRYGYAAEYHADETLLVLGLILSVIGVFFAAPGFVQYRGEPNPQRRGVIAAAGPAMNIVLALVFLLLFALLPFPLNFIMLQGAAVNAWIGVFNLLPFGMFDGAKVLAWSALAYATITIVAAVLAAGTWTMML